MEKIVKDKPVQIGAEKFAINGANADAYTLQYSVDGVFYSDAGEVPANTQVVVLNAVSGMYYQLSGNTTELKIIY